MFSTSSDSSNVVWSVDYSNITSATNDYAAVTTSSNNVVQFSVILKRCRGCKHAHAPEGVGCYDVMGASVAFVSCNCKEHIPEDNLEYLEYLSNKKESL